MCISNPDYAVVEQFARRYEIDAKRSMIVPVVTGFYGKKMFRKTADGGLFSVWADHQEIYEIGKVYDAVQLDGEWIQRMTRNGPWGFSRLAS